MSGGSRIADELSQTEREERGMEPRSLDTPEHAAYRAAILAYGQDDQEVKLLRAEVIDLRADNDALEGENFGLNAEVERLDEEARRRDEVIDVLTTDLREALKKASA